MMIGLQEALTLRQSVHDIKNSSTSLEYLIFEIQKSLQQSARMRFRSIPIAAKASLSAVALWDDDADAVGLKIHGL